MPPLQFACLAYLSVALPGSSLGLIWPSMRLSLGEPVGALGILLVASTIASVIASAAAGRLRAPTGPLVAVGTMLTALGLAAEAFAPALWVIVAGAVLFGFGFGALDTVLNAHAARHFGPRDVNWMHAQLRARRHPRPPARDGAAERGTGLAPDLRDHGAGPGRDGRPADPGPPRLAGNRALGGPIAGEPGLVRVRGRQRADLRRRRDRHRIGGGHLGLRLPDRRAGPAGRGRGGGRLGLLDDDGRPGGWSTARSPSVSVRPASWPRRWPACRSAPR